MPLAVPSTISLSQVNTELAQTSTQIISTSNTLVRSVASVETGSYGLSNLRWGINFPGRQVSVSNATAINGIRYNSGPGITISSRSTGTGARFANSILSITAAGTIRYAADNLIVVGGSSFTRTWLTSGASSDYTANLSIIFGSLTGGNTTGTDLSLSQTRTWFVRASVAASGTPLFVDRSASGRLIIKSEGIVLIDRPISFSAYAERFSGGPAPI